MASFGRSLTYIPPSPTAAGMRSPARRSGSGTPMIVPPPSILSTLENYEHFLSTVDAKLAGLVTGTDFPALGTPQQQYQQQQQAATTATGSLLRQSQSLGSRSSLTQGNSGINPLLSYTTPPTRSLGGSMPPPAAAPTFPMLSGGLLGRSLPVNARTHLTAPLEDLLTTLQAERIFLSTAAAQPVPQLPAANDPAAEAQSKSRSRGSSSSSSASSRSSGRRRRSHSHRHRHSSEKAGGSRRHRKRSDSGDEFDSSPKGHHRRSKSHEKHARKHHSKERRRSSERSDRHRSPERQRNFEERSRSPPRRSQELAATTHAALPPAPLNRWPESRARLAVTEEPPQPESARSIGSEHSLSGGRRPFDDVTPAAIARNAPSRGPSSLNLSLIIPFHWTQYVRTRE